MLSCRSRALRGRVQPDGHNKVLRRVQATNRPRSTAGAQRRCLRLAAHSHLVTWTPSKRSVEAPKDVKGVMAKPRRKKSAKAPTKAKGGRTKTAPAVRRVRVPTKQPPGKVAPYAKAVRLIQRVRLHLLHLERRREKGRSIRRDPLKALREKVDTFLDAVGSVTCEDRDQQDRILKATAGVNGALMAEANRKCARADVERVIGAVSACLTDDAEPAVAMKQFKEAFKLVAAATADRKAHDALLLEHGGFYRLPETGEWALLEGEEILERRKAARERYARKKEPGYVHRFAAVATLGGHNTALAEEIHNKQERQRGYRARVEAALDDAGVTEPDDCWGVIVEGELKFVVKSYLANLVDMDNLPSSRDDAIERAAFFRMLTEIRTRAEFEAETPGKGISPLRGKWTARMPWPTKKDGKARRYLINPKTETIYFDTEQEAIDRKYAWYEAEKPEDWLKTPEK